METPGFWSRDTAVSRVLSPLGALYGRAASLRRDAHPYRAPVPVLCVGNATAGGAGKTPVALALGRQAIARGIAVHFLSRGHGGSLAGPVRVDAARHAAADVGDEPLLLAALAPTWVARDRAAGAQAAAEAGAGLIVMDDGLQNPHVEKDMSLLVVDAGYGFGNGRLIPAGPLREPVALAAKRCRALVLVGEGTPADLPPGLTTIRAHMQPRAHGLTGRPVVAFAGIGRPAKFRHTLEADGVTVIGWHEFADHHRYAATEIDRLRREAAARGAMLVTTAKDYARLPLDLRPGIEVLNVDLVTEDPLAFDMLLDEVPA